MRLLCILLLTAYGQVCPSEKNIASCGVGACISLTNQVVGCLCPSGYGPYGDTSAKCIEIDVCNHVDTKNKLCFNGGTCKSVQGGLGQYTCNCADGYAGDNCQRKKNACDDKATPCLNGGICVSLDDKNFVCNCPKEYEGKYCESKRSMGVGSIGTPLSPLLLITLWALWMALVVIFIWCSVSALLAWWSRRIRRLLNPAAA